MNISEKIRQNLIYPLSVGIGLVGVLIEWYFEHMPNIAESKIASWWFLFNLGGIMIGLTTGGSVCVVHPTAYYIGTFLQWFLITLLVSRIIRKRN